MSVFVNRSLNLKQIQMIGFDMDYTLVRYYSRVFEEITFDYAKNYLVDALGYPKAVRDFVFDYDRAIVGLVIDRQRGNLLKLSRFGKIKMAYHGLKPLDFRTMKKVYQNVVVDLGDPNFQPLDTLFAISVGVLFSMLVELKEGGESLPDYGRLSSDALLAVDTVHRNNSIKSLIRKDPARFVVPDPKVAGLLERYKDYGKKLMIITNSDYSYTRVLLEHAIDPWLKKHRSWREVFDIVITLADKPRFFEYPGRFLRVDPETGLMSNHDGRIEGGIFQGGWFQPLQRDLGLDGREILYIGDHIYGDVVSIKKRCDWRTALVLEDLEREIESIRQNQPIQREIDRLMEEKERIEHRINRLDLDRYEGREVDRSELDRLFQQVDRLNQDISERVVQYRSKFNPYWGEILRSGNEESRYAGQIEEFACIYMTRVSDLYAYSPKTYFRPKRRLLPHEILD